LRQKLQNYFFTWQGLHTYEETASIFGRILEKVRGLEYRNNLVPKAKKLVFCRVKIIYSRNQKVAEIQFWIRLQKNAALTYIRVKVKLDFCNFAELDKISTSRKICKSGSGFAIGELKSQFLFFSLSNGKNTKLF
jgi:hypothetical protein